MSSSKKALLAGSATFDAVAQPMSARSRAFAALNGQAPPAVAEATRTPLERLAHNPFNPRLELTSIREMADSLEGRGVIQPLTVVTRAAFLSAHPGADEAIGAADFVVLDGNRRLAGARLAGLDAVPVFVNDDLAADATELLQNALITAVQHEALDPMDEARALQQLVDTCGSQRQVAKRIGRSNGWVSQRLALLKLTPELQDAVESQELPVDVARTLGRLPAHEQAPAAEAAKQERAAARRAPEPEPSAGPETQAQSEAPAQSEPLAEPGPGPQSESQPAPQSVYDVNTSRVVPPAVTTPTPVLPSQSARETTSQGGNEGSGTVYAVNTPGPRRDASSTEDTRDNGGTGNAGEAGAAAKTVTLHLTSGQAPEGIAEALLSVLPRHSLQSVIDIVRDRLGAE